MPQRRWSLRRWLPKAVLGLCLFFISLGTAFEAPLHAGSPYTLSLSMHNQQFSAHILRAPLEHVLTTLTSYKPFRFTIKGNVKDDLISASFVHLSLLESLERLLLEYDYAIIQHRLDPTLSPSKFPYLMEVVVLSRNPEEPYSGQTRASIIVPQKTTTQPSLLHTNQEIDKPDQPNPLSIETDNDTSDFQSTVEEALQDSDPETRSLIQELLQE